MLPKTAKDTKDSQSRLDFFLMDKCKSTTDDGGMRRAMEALDVDSEEDEVPGGHEPDWGNA